MEPPPTQMLPSDVSFTANSADRWLLPRAASSATEPSRFLALCGAVLVYAIVAAMLVFERNFEPVAPTEPTEIPIEILAEPPPPPPKPEPPPPSPEPQPTAQPLDEKPAFDAPRAANDEKVERDAPDKETTAQAPPPPELKPLGDNADPGKPTELEAKTDTEPAAKETPVDPAKDKTVAEPAPNGDVKQQAPQPPASPEPEAPRISPPRRRAPPFPRSRACRTSPSPARRRRRRSPAATPRPPTCRSSMG